MNCSSPLPAVDSNCVYRSPTLDLTKLALEADMVTSIDISGAMDFSFCEKDASDTPLPIYVDTRDNKENEGSIPLNTVALPVKLQRELGANLMDWFYRYAKNNVKDFQIPEVKKRQPIAQVIPYITACPKGNAPEIKFSLKKPSERQIMIILRYNLLGTKFENFILNSENPCVRRECIGFQSNDMIITVGISLVLEPSWSSLKRWEGLPYSFSAREHFISWGKIVSVDAQTDYLLAVKKKMIEECKQISEEAFFPLYEELCEIMLRRIGLNSMLKPKVITSKGSSLLALDFTYLTAYTESGGVRVCGNELKYLTFYKVQSFLKSNPDIFSYSKGVGKKETLDPRKITLYHFDETKGMYILFEIEVGTGEWTRLERCVKPDEIIYESIERRVSQYL